MQSDGRAQQNRRMNIVTASVHHAGFGGTILDFVLFLNW
jgi:hypothetical protein